MTAVERGNDANFGTCAHCGRDLEADVWYPATSERDEEGEPRLYSFCDGDCEAAWVAAN